jgi:hemerythrin-like domain-containing protein
MKSSDPKDRITRIVEKGDHDEELSPLSPPEAHSPPGKGQGVEYADMHPFLQSLRDEHEQCLEALTLFEETMDKIEADGPGEESDDGLGRFFWVLDRVLLPHNRREETELFPLLHKRLIDAGEHSLGVRQETGVNVLQRDHVEFLQISAIMTNFFRLAPRLPDEKSRNFVLNSALQQGRALVEDLRLHIFREDEVMFSLAHRLISSAELSEMAGAREEDMIEQHVTAASEGSRSCCPTGC